SRPSRSSGSALRALTFGALALVILIVAYLLFVTSGGATYKLEFEDAGQLVKGDQVEVGGVPIGEIKNIQLTSQYKALITIHISGSLVPLHEGSTAEIRQPSLSQVANRYIMIVPGPNNRPALSNGATLPTTQTKGLVDLDQVFDALNPRTRKGLANVIEGFAQQYSGAEAAANSDTQYFGPALNAVTHVFSELSADQPVLLHFLVNSSDALQILGAHSEHLTDLIENSDIAFKAIAVHDTALANGLHQLPGTFAAGTKTFTELPATFHALKEFIDASKPTTKPLITEFTKLNTLLKVTAPAVENLSHAVDQPGANNDLTDVALLLPRLAKTLETGSPDAVKALEESVPVTSYFGPYSPELTGLFRDFGQDTAYYDANGHYARISPLFDAFKLGEKNTLTPVSPSQGIEGLKTHELRRCPGGGTQPAADGSSPFEDEGKLSCDPTEHP
ncbi:MAG: MlaD family protein, partial [Solirubrobacteraceae bacterium]